MDLNYLDIQKLGAGILLEHLKTSCAELGILQVSDAPHEELRSAQKKVDMLEAEALRRMSW
jgi:hypothetical protein